MAALEWGVLEVEGGPGPYKDAKLWPGGSREWDWNETGTRHVPGVQLADVEEVLEHGARSVVIGRGMHGRLEIPPETKAALAERGIALHAAGCFWGVEETFRQLPGVLETAVGFMGGSTANPSYRDVCGGRTGHAEVVHLEYDPDRISYDELLEAFWSCHDPTTLNRQGPDVGDQYRSAIFYHTPEQEAAARASKERLDAAGRFRRPIVTAIEPAAAFWRAEEYHQRYLEKRGEAACRVPGS